MWIGALKLAALVSASGIAVYSAYTNAHDEATISAAMMTRYTIAWSALPVVMLIVYMTSALIARNSAKSFTPAMTLIIVYAIVFGFCAWNGPTDPTRADRTHLIFVPMILGVFSLPFFVFMVDRNISMLRRRLRGEEPTHDRHPQETR